MCAAQNFCALLALFETEVVESVIHALVAHDFDKLSKGAAALLKSKMKNASLFDLNSIANSGKRRELKFKRNMMRGVHG